jgi:hypothetical protein
VAPVLPRFHRRQLELLDEQAVADAVGPDLEEPVHPGIAGGDARRLRGIPCIGVGVPGARRETHPLQALLDREASGRR